MLQNIIYSSRPPTKSLSKLCNCFAVWMSNLWQKHLCLMGLWTEDNLSNWGLILRHTLLPPSQKHTANTLECGTRLNLSLGQWKLQLVFYLYSPFFFTQHFWIVLDFGKVCVYFILGSFFSAQSGHKWLSISFGMAVCLCISQIHR